MFIRSQSAVWRILIVIAIPIVLSGCGIITGARPDVRLVGVAGSVIEVEWRLPLRTSISKQREGEGSLSLGRLEHPPSKDT